MKLAQYKERINELIEFAVKHNVKTATIRPITQVGRGKHSSYSTDHTREYAAYLDDLKLKYEIGNDSPRGGQLGKFIMIKIDKRNAFIKSLLV